MLAVLGAAWAGESRSSCTMLPACCPLRGPAALNSPANEDGSWIWLKPHLVAEVEYLEITPQLRLRHPVFVRFRFDKKPEECRLAGELL
ncbi:MAG: hypothetical protein ACOX53_11170 [Limnochordia bacterium]